MSIGRVTNWATPSSYSLSGFPTAGYYLEVAVSTCMTVGMACSGLSSLLAGVSSAAPLFFLPLFEGLGLDSSSSPEPSGSDRSLSAFLFFFFFLALPSLPCFLFLPRFFFLAEPSKSESASPAASSSLSPPAPVAGEAWGGHRCHHGL